MNFAWMLIEALTSARVASVDQALKDGKLTQPQADWLKQMVTTMAQLQLMRGNTVTFHTALCLMHNTTEVTINVPTEVSFRDLPDNILESYLLTEEPYDCAGSAKSEGLGIALLQSIRSDDPTALIGLPLITLTGLLRDAGFAIPTKRPLT